MEVSDSFPEKAAHTETLSCINAADEPRRQRNRCTCRGRSCLRKLEETRRLQGRFLKAAHPYAEAATSWAHRRRRRVDSFTRIERFPGFSHPHTDK